MLVHMEPVAKATTFLLRTLFLGINGWAVARIVIVRLEVIRFAYDMVLFDPPVFFVVVVVPPSCHDDATSACGPDANCVPAGCRLCAHCRCVLLLQ